MPRLSDSMEEGTILTWLKQVGDEVAVGDELVEIETDKANMAYESDVAGTLTEILAQEGETLPIGAPIARRWATASAAPRADGEATDRRAAGPVAAGDPPAPPVAKASSSGGTPDGRQPADAGAGASGSRPRRWRGGWRRSAGVDLASLDGLRSRGTDRQGGRGGRRADAAEPCRSGSGRPRRRRAPAAGRLPRPPRATIDGRGALEAAAGRRAADGGVEGDGASLLPRRPRST